MENHPILPFLSDEIILVGNAPFGDDKKGEFIDSFSTVIRFNKGARKENIEKYGDYIGRKTNLIATNAVALDNLDENMKGIPIFIGSELIQPGLVFKPEILAKARSLSENIFFFPKHVGEELAGQYDYRNPSLGLKTVFFLKKLGKKVDIIQFSDNPTFTHFFGPSEGIGMHRPDLECEILKNLADKVH